jgi:signal transduction histidine kinase/CheY-like chemotaxis protein
MRRSEQSEKRLSRKPAGSKSKCTPGHSAVCAYDSEALHELFDDFEVGVANVMASGDIIYANAKFAEALGNPPHRGLCGSNLRAFIAAGSWESMDAALKEAGNQPVTGEIKVEAVSGRSQTIRLSLSPAGIKEKGGIRIVAQEVTELVETNIALRENETSLRTLSARILQLQDQERRKIARDLHDTTGQELAVLVMSLKHLGDSLDRPDIDVRKALVDAAELARKVNEEIRTLSYLLHPPLLDEFGLVSALKWYVEGFAQRTGIEVKLEIHDNLRRFPAEKETALFRVVQESLTNVMRHSGSRRAKIVVCVSVDEVELTVQDEGKGIPSAALDRLSTGGKMLGVGIPGLRERLRQFGGKLEIFSAPSGTRLVATVPIAEAGADEIFAFVDAAAKRTGAVAAQSPPRRGRKRILIVDDHELMRRGIRGLLENQTDLEICGEAKNGSEAVQKNRELNPDLIILDLTMPGSGGLSAANHIRHSGSEAHILVFTTHSFPGIERMIRSAGCKGIVLKADAGRDLLRGVRTVLAGGEFYEAPVVRTQTA